MVQSPKRRSTSSSSPASSSVSCCCGIDGNRRGYLRAFLLLPLKTQLLGVACAAVVLLLLVVSQNGAVDRSKRLLDEAAFGDALLLRQTTMAPVTTNKDDSNDDANQQDRHQGMGQQRPPSSNPAFSRALTPWRPRYPWRAFFIAINLFNNAAVIPHLSEAMSAFLRDEVAPYFNIAERVFISIFSNGSEDTTAKDILDVLVPSLVKAGVPPERMRVEVDGVCCGGLRRRPKSMDRIHWMACVRNAAMAPLYEQGLALFQPATHDDEDAWMPVGLKNAGGFTSANRSHVAEDQSPSRAPSLTSDDVVVLFFNDILFQRADITTLLETNYARSERLRAAVYGSGRAPSADIPQEEHAHSALWDGFNMACGMDYYTSFYDRWVTRSVDGRPFDSWPPFAQDRTTQSIFAASNQLGPITDGQHRHIAAPVRCCWNGVAAIRGSMFLEHGIRFREPGSTMFNMSRTQDACYSSECLLICQDIVKAVCKLSGTTTTAAATQQQQQPPDNDGDNQPSTTLDNNNKKCDHESGHVGIFVNPHVKVAYDEASFELHRRHWFVSSSWFFRVVSLARVGSWMLPDTFRTPTKGGDVDPVWMECLLPVDTLPLFTAFPWAGVAIGFICSAAVLSFCVVQWCPTSHAAGVVRRQLAAAASLIPTRKNGGTMGKRLAAKQHEAEDGTSAGLGGSTTADQASIVFDTPTIARRFPSVRIDSATFLGSHADV